MNCLTGNCHVATTVWGQKSVDITDLDIKDSQHPNFAPFDGTLLLLDEPSNQPPHGSDGHPIFVPTRVAEERLDTLPGMAINYQDDLEGHNPAKKVGVITKAWIDGKKVRVEGHIWKKDFPESLRTFRMNKGRLGMSMELGDVYVRDKDEDIWHLEDFYFTGATVLRKDHAAYENTDLAASSYFVKALAAARSAVEVIQGKGGKPVMADDKKKKQQSSGQNLVAAISASFATALKPLIEEQRKTSERMSKAIGNVSSSQEELAKGLHELAAGNISAAANLEVEDAEVIDVEAGASDPSDATMASAGASNPSAASDPSDASDPTDASEMDAGVDPTNFSAPEQNDDGSGATPGDLNPDASANYREQSKGPASSRIARTGKTGPSRGIAASRERGTFVAKSMAAAKVIRSLTASNQRLVEENRRFKNRVEALEASVDRYADRVERRTITPEVASLLEKSGHDVRELMASKTKLTVSEVDDLFLKSNIQLEPTMRAAFKNQLVQAGLMEQGEVRRYN